MINAKSSKMIRKYARLRGKTDPRITEKILSDFFKRSSKEKQQFFRKEMQEYFDAIDSGRIKAGQSLLHAALPVDGLKVEDVKAE